MDMGMMGCGMTMMGIPQVVGAGVDCNNYIDVRNEHHKTDQATIRFDQNFHRGDSIFARLALQEATKVLPWGAVWDQYCATAGVAVGRRWIERR